MVDPEDMTLKTIVEMNSDEDAYSRTGELNSLSAVQQKPLGAHRRDGRRFLSGTFSRLQFKLVRRAEATESSSKTSSVLVSSTP
jgi:hypothetical protein